MNSDLSMNAKLAWRNMWRNPRRTTVILIAVIIGIWAMIFLGSIQRGMNDQMIRTNIATMTGQIQVHRSGYRSDPVVQNSITDVDEVQKTVEEQLPPDSHWASRVRVNAVASNARHTHGVVLVGIDPEQEAKVSFIESAITEGRYLKPDEKNGIVIGKALADKFETELGKKLVLMSQATDKEIASKAFRIVGIYNADLEATEKQFVFVSQKRARKMLKLGDGISEIAIVLPEIGNEDKTVKALEKALPDGYEVLSWRELLPMVNAFLDMMNGFLVLWDLVVFIAMGFGIVNTLLMAVFERMREFGLLKALGMKPSRIVVEVLTESFLLLVLGMIVGNAISYAGAWALSGPGIDLSALAAGAEFVGIARVIYPSVVLRDVLIANGVVFFLGLLVSLYPAVRAARFTPVEAMAKT